MTLGAQYVCFLANILGGLDASKDFLQQVAKDQCPVDEIDSELSRDIFLQRQLHMVDICANQRVS